MKFTVEITGDSGYYEFSLKLAGSRHPIMTGADSSLPNITKSIGSQIQATIDHAATRDFYTRKTD